MEYQEILQKIQGYLAPVDQQLLAALAVLALLLLLFWRVLRRTSRVEREVVRLNERLERIREEVRTISRPSLSVAPVQETRAAAEPVEQSEVAEKPAALEPDLVDAPAEEDDVLSRAAASLAESGLDEGLAASDDNFSFGEEEQTDSGEVSGTDEEPLFEAASTADEFSAPDEEPEPSLPAPEAEEPRAEEPAAPAEEPADEEQTASGVVKLEEDPARPGVRMVRCLSCNYKLAYPEKLSGKRVRCPSCRTGLDLP